MALSTSQIANILFKKLQKVGSTLDARQFFEEPYLGAGEVTTDQIWAQSSSVPTTAPGGTDQQTTGIVQRWIDLVLTAVTGTTNAFYNANLVDAIPFNFGDGSYNFTLKDSTGASIPFGSGDWIVDRNAGTVTFYGTVPSNMPPKISFYKYVGTKGIPAAPGWTKYTVTHTQLQTAALTNNITLFTLGAKEVLQGMVVKSSIAFAGTSITAYDISIGIAGTLDKYLGTYDAFAAVADANAQTLAAMNAVESFSGGTAIKIAATATGNNLSASTAGSIDVWVLKSTLP
jgi:hypothetical protein